MLVGELLDALLDRPPPPRRASPCRPASRAWCGSGRQASASGTGGCSARRPCSGRNPTGGCWARSRGCPGTTSSEACARQPTRGCSSRTAAGDGPDARRGAAGSRLEWRHAMVGDAVLTHLLPPSGRRSPGGRRGTGGARPAGRRGARRRPVRDGRRARARRRAVPAAGPAGRRPGRAARQRRSWYARRRRPERCATRWCKSGSRAHARRPRPRGAGSGRRGPRGSHRGCACRALPAAGQGCGVVRAVGRRRTVRRPGGTARRSRASVLLANAAFGRAIPRGPPDSRPRRRSGPSARARADVLCARWWWPAAAPSSDDITAPQTSSSGPRSWRRSTGCRGAGRGDVRARPGRPVEREDGAALERARELALDAGMLRQALSSRSCSPSTRWWSPAPGRRGARAGCRGPRGALDLTGLQALGEVMAAGARAAADDVPGMTRLLGRRPRARTPRSRSARSPRPSARCRRCWRTTWRRPTGASTRGCRRSSATARPHPWRSGGLGPAAHGGRGRRRPAAVSAHLAGGPAPVEPGGMAYAEAVAAGRTAGRRTRWPFAGGRGAARRRWRHRLLRLLVLRSAVLDGWGDPVPALRADLAEFERFGDERLARTCRDLLRQAGAPTRRGRGSSPCRRTCGPAA